VFASNFRDRVVHHLLVNILEPIFERRFIYDVYNNRKNRGTHKATKRAKKFMSQTPNGYYLQLDIRGFFYHLNKMILMDKIKEGVLWGVDRGIVASQDVPNILWLSSKIIFHDPTTNYHFKGDKTKLSLLPPHKTLFKIPKSRGLPIGNLTSQFFANVYMNEFDNYIKRVLKVKRYIRYVDDFVLFDSSKERLIILKKQIEEYLAKELKLSLRDDSRLKLHTQGLDFLGYIIRPNYILVRRRVVNNFKYKKALFLKSYEAQKGKMSLAQIKRFLSVQASFAGHIKHANSYNLSQKVGVIDEKNPFEYDYS
jgi:hypothetical protein